MTPDEIEDERRSQILAKLMGDPVLCHAVLFARRHRQATPDFHKAIIRRWWSPAARAGVKAFRGGGKSTISEDAMAARGLFGMFRYGLFVSASYGLACQRLAAVKNELRTNAPINELFGNQEGETWNEGEITLKNGAKIQALGAGQSLRGLKHLDWRPDFVIIDDLEDYGERVPEKAAMQQNLDWLIGGFIPACDPAAVIRMMGTPLDPNAVLERVSADPGWAFDTYPIVTPPVADPDQWERSNWPDRFPVEKVREMFDSMQRLGEAHKFTQEFLCQSELQSLKPFQVRHIVRAPSVPDWAPTILVIDPARTVNERTSARTGYVVFSWVGRKLYVRAAYGAFHKPDEIVAETFKLDDIFRPIWVRPEQDGLHEFLLQPYRARMLETGHVLPLLPLRAPRERSKDQFIMGLQPFLEAGDVLMCDSFPDLEAELLSFPSGRKDVVNALAYAPRTLAGKAVYEDFGGQHVAPDTLRPQAGQAAYLCVGARGGHTAASLVQLLNGSVRVFADWVREGTAADALEAIISEATLAARRRPEVFATSDQFDHYNNYGLPAACTRLKLNPTRGPTAASSIGSLQPFLRRISRQPAFMVNRGARWTINALAAGYTRGLDRNDVLQAQPDEGYYRTLMEPLEGFVRWLAVQADVGDNGEINYQMTQDGRRYISSRASGGSGQRRDLKV